MASLAPFQGNLGTTRAAHLLRRTNYRFTRQRVDQLANMTASAAVAQLFTPSPLVLEQPLYDNGDTPTNEAYAWINPPGTPLPSGVEDFQLRRPLVTWWLSELYESPSIHAKMTVFLHQYSIVTQNAAGTTHFYDYIALLRWTALGNWKKFCTKLVMDNCMLRYLNNNTNTAANPNENFAREFLELFTIGKGEQAGDGDYTTYTEEDIKIVARTLTGYRTRIDRTMTDPETNIPRGTINTSLHDWNEKVFSARLQSLTIPAVPTGQRTAAKVLQELDMLVNRIFEQDATARNFVRRLYRFFVGEKITQEIETDIIIPLATQFKTGGYEIAPILQTLLTSRHFYGADAPASIENIVGGMLKSPLELAYQSISFFNIPLPNPSTEITPRFRFFSQGVWDRMLTLSGFPLFQAADVAGYPGYYQGPDYSHSWFNSSTIIGRYKLPTMLISGRLTVGGNANGQLNAKLNVAPWLRNSGFCTDPSDPHVLVDELLRYMLARPVDSARFNYFYQDIFLNNLPPADWTYEWENYISTNNDVEVKIALERLITAIMYSQEYQTF
jgi:uncharacterized protein (DUF1800 family)